jgi:hypothetical protein
MSDLIKEIQKRKPSDYFSPGCRKNTLTEKLLLFGGAIQEAGAVKSNKIKKGATSDFMEIERQRGFLWQLPYWLLNIETIKSTFWILRVTRILLKILTEL